MLTINRFVSPLFLFTTVLSVSCPFALAADSATPTTQQPVEAARALVQRLLPDDADRFVFEFIPAEAGRDLFEIESRQGRVVIRGNTGVSMATGLNWYLKHYCRCHVSLCGNQLELPDPLPVVEPKMRRTSWARHRYFLNYCCFGYSLPWYDWDQWERLVDWMALNGINTPLSVTGEEAVWQAVCRRLGMTDPQIGEFLAGPPYLPFQWMGCLDGWGGPLPAGWIDGHEALAKKIVSRQRELGMTPVLQGFTGHVPQEIERLFPEAKLHKIHWLEWHTTLLDPLDPLFAKIAAIWMEEQQRRFGTSHLYAADAFIEMTPPSGEPQDLANMSRAIYGGMAQHDPQAVWVLQTWNFSYQRSFWTEPRIEAFLSAVSAEQMLCLDLACEDRPQWSRTNAFSGKPWLWCNIQNYGNTIFLGGALDRINADLPAARADAKKGRLAGLGFVNEGLGVNPVVHDLMYEMAWRDGPVDLDAWIADYAAHRYGQPNADARKAWTSLLHTVYNGTNRTRSVIDQVPTVTSRRGGVPYANHRLARAWHSLLAASDELGDVDAYRFDLVNVGRQVLTNQAGELHGEIVKAAKAGDAVAFDEAAKHFLRLIRDLDALLGTREEFLLGRWLSDARRWGTTDEDRARMEWNARRGLTLWGETTVIDDYARKEWSGMLAGYYLKRWEMVLGEYHRSLQANRPFDKEASDRKLRAWMKAWSDSQTRFPTQPRGDSVVLAHTLWDRYADALAYAK